MFLEQQIRKMARLSHYQQIYNASKDCSGIRLFKNEYNFSGIQSLFLYWLNIYAMLYDELGKLEWGNLDNQVIKDDDRVDAFLYWRSKKIEKDIRKSKREEKKANKKTGNKMKIFSGAKKKVTNNG